MLVQKTPEDAVYHYVDAAKRILLELRVKDFRAADVVALAAMIEARDRVAADTQTPGGPA